jgi:general secretion pathway protein L
MKRQVLALDINDEFVTAVVVRQSGQDREIAAFGTARFHDRDEIAAALPAVLEQVGWKEGTCICGIPLSGVSLRNLSIPFVEKRKINQILPMELEDQLVKPVEEQLVEFMVTGGSENESQLLVAALPKTDMQQFIEQLSSSGMRPEFVTLRTVALTEQYAAGMERSEGFLFIDAGFHSVNIAIVSSGRIIFMRRLAYPDRVFTAHPFIYDENGPRIDNHEVAMECISLLCNDIKRSMGFYQLEYHVDSLPERIVMSGCMAHVASFREKVESEFGYSVELGDLQLQTGVVMKEELAAGWNSGLHDHALALALQGLRKKVSINFRKNEFAPPRLLFASQRQLIAASIVLFVLLLGVIAYLGFGYRNLQARYDNLGGDMEALFKETFPDATRIVDPLVQMKTNLRNVEAPAIATPIFSGRKRTLSILADISERIPESVEIHIARLAVDEESVSMKGTTDTFNNVNLIQGVLRKSPEYDDVAIVSAAVEKDSGLIRFELRLRTAGAS